MIDLGIRRIHLYSAVRVTSSFDGPSGPGVMSGTGFFVGMETGSFLVTNRHVVDPAYADSRRVGSRIHAIRADGYRLVDGVREATAAAWELGPEHLLLPEAHAEDVAIVPFTSSGDVEGVPMPSTTFTRNLLASTDEFLEDIGPGDFVAISGYPNLAGSQVQDPLVIPGIVSSDPGQPLSVRPGDAPGRLFYVHAFSRQGLSGAPVYAVQRGLALGNGLSGPASRPPRLIGVNAGHIPGDGHGPASFSYAVRSDVILELAARWEVMVAIATLHRAERSRTAE